MKIRWLSFAGLFASLLGVLSYVHYGTPRAATPTTFMGPSSCACSTVHIPGPASPPIGTIANCTCGALQCVVAQSGPQYGHSSLFCVK
jgi:hypothetical protein